VRVDGLLLWTQSNWFSLLQSIGIIGGLLFAAVSFREAARARRGSDLLALTKQHQELWSEVHRRPDLARIVEEEMDLVSHPISRAEREFLILILSHCNTAWHLSRDGAVLPLKALARDVGTFFRLPIPNRVWSENKASHDPQFVEFMESCLTKCAGST
jgi:hypothetical protein